HGIGFRRTITAHDPDRLLRSGLALHLPDQVDQMRIDARLLFAPPIAQEPVELFQRRLVVTAVALERDGDVFVGVHVMQRQRAGVALGDGVLQHARAEEQHQRGDSARVTGASRGETTALQARVTDGHWRSRVDVDRTPPAAAPTAANNPNAVLIWEGLTRSFGYPTPDPTMANGAVWRKMALIWPPVG